MGRSSIRTVAGRQPGQRLTVLDCEVGQHTGHFTITRMADGRWSCHDCLAKMEHRLDAATIEQLRQMRNLA